MMTKGRHILKTISYRIVGTSVTIIGALLLGSSIEIESLIGMTELAVKPILYFFAEKTNVFVKQVLRVRLRLTFQHPDREKFLFNKPHTDLPDHNGPYKTLVYYINDSDGDTFIFDKFFNKEDSRNVLKDIDKKIILQHTPKQGSAVYFEGHQYHAGNTPIKYKHRYVINFDFTI